jgi:adiponectin receptor
LYLVSFFKSFFHLLGAAPATHAVIIYGFPRMFEMGFLYLCLMAVMYIGGGIMYGVRIPERFFPGKTRLSIIIYLLFFPSRSF